MIIASSPPTDVSSLNHFHNSGGILFLELVELKEELCIEKQELDYLEQQRTQLEASIKSLSHQVEKADTILNMQIAFKELQQVLDEIEEETDMLTLEISVIESNNLELKDQIQQLLIMEKDEDKRERRSSRKIENDEVDLASKQDEKPKRRSSRYLRHQRRRMNQFSHSFNTTDSVSMNSSLSSMASMVSNKSI